MEREELTQDNYYILTGGPGVGKTALINELLRRGYACIPEAARAIIREQMENGGNGVPWRDSALYRDMMLSRSVDDYLQARNRPEPVMVFDRGIPDTIAHCRLSGLDETAALEAAHTYRCNRLVFLLPPWRDIYTGDAERKQTFEESVAVYTALQDVYRELGYDLRELPCVPVQARADLLLEYVLSAKV